MGARVVELDLLAQRISSVTQVGDNVMLKSAFTGASGLLVFPIVAVCPLRESGRCQLPQQWNDRFPERAVAPVVPSVPKALAQEPEK